jgi:hypothetical protein
MKPIIDNDIVKEVLKVFKGSKIIRVGDTIMNDEIEQAEPIMAFANACKNIGWDTRLKELTTEQVEGLLFIIQEAKDIKNEGNLGRLESAYIKWSGGQFPPSSGIPF